MVIRTDSELIQVKGVNMSEDKKRALEILRKLDKAYPDAPKTYLMFSNPFEMTIATILSARATDAGVNKVTPELFGKYPDPKSLAKANAEDVAMIIKPCGAYNRKTSYIIETARMIDADFGGTIPKTMEALVTFPGVSRKTANVVLQVVFGLAEGVIVDTHIMRVTVRLGFSKHDKKADKIEKDLITLLPKDKWIDYARLIGAHGRRTCKSSRPRCSECVISNLCPSSELAD
ncbi:MAG: endonuclease III [Candidatus Thorarchaeota archaeon]|nr:endonuclease III [Candidatus Thorarchaeota archaeon]